MIIKNKIMKNDIYNAQKRIQYNTLKEEKAKKLRFPLEAYIVPINGKKYEVKTVWRKNKDGICEPVDIYEEI